MRKTLFLSVFLLMLLGVVNVMNARDTHVLPANDWTYDETAPLITDVSQFSVNSIQPKEGAGLDGLIDGNTGTHFHSAYNSKNGGILVDAKHYLQVSLPEAIKSFQFTMNGRSGKYHDTPNDVTILATNTPDDEGSWTEVAHLTNMISGNPASVEYSSPRVEMGDSYSNVRFVVNNTTSGRKESTYGQYYWNLTQFNMFESIEVTNKDQLFQRYVDTFNNLDLSTTFLPGNDPGYYKEDIVEAFKKALKEAQVATSVTHTDDEYDTFADALADAYDAVQKAFIPVTDGYYYVVQSDETFMNVQDVEKAMFANSDHYMHWGDLKQSDPNFIFYIKQVTDSTYSVQNFGTEEYMGGVVNKSQPIPTTKEFENPQSFKLYDSGRWRFFNNLNSQTYHCGGHNNGAGTLGMLISWEDASCSFGKWSFRKIEDESVLAALEETKHQNVLDNDLSQAADAAKEAYDAAFVYDLHTESPLITNADDDDDENRQINTNAVSVSTGKVVEGSYKNLIDGDINTLFHTIGSGVTQNYHNLQVDLKDNPQQQFVFRYIGRNSPTAHENPCQVYVFGTNDDELGADVNSSTEKWRQVAALTSGFPGHVQAPVYVSPGIEADQAYRYYRFEVRMTTGWPGNRNNYTGLPYFNLSEFQMYSYSVNVEESQYTYIDGLKEACDKLKALIDAAKDKVVNHTSTADDVAPLQEAAAYVRSFLADTTEYAALHKEAQMLVDSALVGEQIGYFSEQSIIDDFQNKINAIDATVDLNKPVKTALEKAAVDMKAAIDEMLTKVNTVEPNKWYYMVNLGPNAYAKNCAVYQIGTNVGDDIPFGLYDAETEEANYYIDPYSLWRFVPIEGTSFYGIQNMGSSHFIGQGNGLSAVVYLDSKPYPYAIKYMGKGQMALQPQDSVSLANNYVLHAKEANMRLVTWQSYMNCPSAWTFVPMTEEAELDGLSMNIMQNSINIKTLPFDIPAGENSLMGINAGLKTYALKNITVNEADSTTTVELVEQEAVKAGVPFVIAYGDYTLANEEINLAEPFFFPAPADVDTTAYTANGLVGTLNGLVLKKPGLGYMLNDGLHVTEDAFVTINGGSGYINPSLCTPQEGSADLVLTLAGGLINGVKPVAVAKATDKVNVYSIDGKLLRQNVKATEATRGLNKGIYVVDKDKVAVK